MKNNFYKNLLTGALLVGLISSVFANEVQANEIEANELIREFNYIDQNLDAQITFDEFFVVMMHHGSHEMHHEFLMADDDHSQTLSFKEAKIFEVSYEEYSQADEDGNGEVDLQEFINAYIDYTFRESDLNKNESIDFTEFKTAQKDNS